MINFNDKQYFLLHEKCKWKFWLGGSKKDKLFKKNYKLLFIFVISLNLNIILNSFINISIRAFLLFAFVDIRRISLIKFYIEVEIVHLSSKIIEI